MYSEMYSPKRNHFVPEKEVPKTLDLLPPVTPQTDAGILPPALPPSVVAPPSEAPPATPPVLPPL